MAGPEPEREWAELLSLQIVEPKTVCGPQPMASSCSAPAVFVMRLEAEAEPHTGRSCRARMEGEAH